MNERHCDFSNDVLPLRRIVALSATPYHGLH
jgi:hypothetical protein